MSTKIPNAQRTKKLEKVVIQNYQNDHPLSNYNGQTGFIVDEMIDNRGAKVYNIQLDHSNIMLTSVDRNNFAVQNPKLVINSGGSLNTCTIAILREKAAKRGISLKGVTLKGDIIAKLRRKK